MTCVYCVELMCLCVPCLPCLQFHRIIKSFMIQVSKGAGPPAAGGVPCCLLWEGGWQEHHREM